jgi:hypothetical protein
MTRYLVALGLLAGCSGSLPEEVPEEDIAIWAAAVSCDRSAECARSFFDTAYYGMEDCRATEEQAWELIAESLSDCDYDPTRAANRLEEIELMSCEEWYEGEATEAFGEIWDDCDFFPF